LLTVEYKLENNLLYRDISALEFASLISSSELTLKSNPRSIVAISQPRTPVVCIGEVAAAGESSPSVRLAAWVAVV